MEFRLSEAQVELQQTLARFSADRLPLDTIVEREGRSADAALWRQLAELGVFGLMLDEDAGGSGLGVVEAAIVFEQLGSFLVPGPLLWSVLGAPIVEGAITGETRVSGVEVADIVDGVTLVPHASEADVVLVLHDDRVVAHRTDDLGSAVSLDPLDPLTPVGRLAGLDRGGAVVGDQAEAQRVRLLGTVLSAATLAGVASRALEVARTYALEREQFGTPIGSFQAIKHMLADMYVASTLAQSEVYAAAATADDPDVADAVRSASAAKLVAGEAAIGNACAAVQVLGGMGFTWDMLPNYLLKRGWVIESSFGDAETHALAMGSKLVGVR